jgi:hypothetical protein
MILKRNPNYHGPTPARFDAIAFREGLARETAGARVKSGAWDGAALDDPLLGPDCAVARKGRRGSRFRYEVVSDRTAPEDTGAPGYALLSSRLGRTGSDGALDLAALCLRESGR